MEQTAIPLPKFLKIFTSNNVPLPKAMAVASKIYKDYNTPAKLEILDETKLLAAGVDDKDSRKIVMTALRKAGYRVKSTRPNQSPAGPSTQPMTAVEVLTTPTKRKRKRPTEDVNEFLPSPKDETANIGNLQFDEVMDEQVLKTKSTVVNRAPLMTAWSTLVAERLGFQREEALSIASVYTEMNAVSKGVSMGIYKPGTQFQRSLEAVKEGSQPYTIVQDSGLSVASTFERYRRSPKYGLCLHLPRTSPNNTHIIGALRLLVESFTPEEINAHGWALYADFRPDVKGWGERAEVKCETILSLRKSKGTADPAGKVDAVVKTESFGHEEDLEPPQKRTRGLTLEEYEAALDQDTTFDDINLNLGTDDNT